MGGGGRSRMSIVSSHALPCFGLHVVTGYQFTGTLMVVAAFANHFRSALEEFKLKYIRSVMNKFLLQM
jgi:hypothetical protein